MIVILFGPPGAGKGTQAQILREKLNVPHLSTGEMFRRAMDEGTEVGKQAKSYMDAGNLVPDEVTVNVIKHRIEQADCANGFILDGFPRTVAQAEALDKLFAATKRTLDLVISIEVNDEEIVKRQSGRRMACKSGRVYHVEHNPPKVAGKCDETGEDLVQRDDDKEDVVRHRLGVYHLQTAPVKDFYMETSRLQKIDGMRPIAEVSADILKRIK